MDLGYAWVSTAEITAATGLTRSTLYRHLPARPPEPVTAAPPAAGEASRRPPATPAGRLACPSCGHQPASRAEALRRHADLAVLWLHLDGDHLTEARHCVRCQPHEHIVDIACADCGDGPLITGQPPELGQHPGVPAMAWLRARGWHTYPQLLCPDHARQPADPALVSG